MEVILIAGKGRHGKDTTGNIIEEYLKEKGYKVARSQISRTLKEYAKYYFGWDGREETKPRDLLQKLGTEIIREKLGKEEFFVNRMIEDIDVLSYFFDFLIVTDIRLILEIEKISKVTKPLKLKVIRKDFDNGFSEEQKNHRTEVELDNYDKFDYVIENTTLEKLKEDTINIIKERYNELLNTQ